MIDYVFPGLFLVAGLWIILSAKRQKFADNARVVANLLVGLIVLVMTGTIVAVAPRLADLVTAPMVDGTAKPKPSIVGPDATPEWPSVTEAFGHWLHDAIAWLMPVLAMTSAGLVVLGLGFQVAKAAAPGVRRWMVGVARRRAFVETHCAAATGATTARLVRLWGPRPAEMTRCVECGRNEWPACRCALQREGYAMAPEPAAPERPLDQYILPPWGTADGRPIPISTAPAAPAAALGIIGSYLATRRSRWSDSDLGFFGSLAALRRAKAEKEVAERGWWSARAFRQHLDDCQCAGPLAWRHPDTCGRCAKPYNHHDDARQRYLGKR